MNKVKFHYGRSATLFYSWDERPKHYSAASIIVENYLTGKQRPEIIASASLYSFEVRQIEEALKTGREYCKKHKRNFEGMKLDIDAEGGVWVHIDGVDSFKL